MYFDKKFRSNRLEFQPSFIVKLLFITVLQSVERVLGNKVIFSNLVIYSLSILTSCQFTNEPNCEISRGVFQNRRVCGQAFPLLPSPPPPPFFCSRSNFRALTRLETLATQAAKTVSSCPFRIFLLSFADCMNKQTHLSLRRTNKSLR